MRNVALQGCAFVLAAVVAFLVLQRVVGPRESEKQNSVEPGSVTTGPGRLATGQASSESAPPSRRYAPETFEPARRRDAPPDPWTAYILDHTEMAFEPQALQKVLTKTARNWLSAYDECTADRELFGTMLRLSWDIKITGETLVADLVDVDVDWGDSLTDGERLCLKAALPQHVSTIREDAGGARERGSYEGPFKMRFPAKFHPLEILSAPMME